MSVPSARLSSDLPIDFNSEPLMYTITATKADVYPTELANKVEDWDRYKMRVFWNAPFLYESYCLDLHLNTLLLRV